MNRRPVIGVMGAGSASDKDVLLARELGREVARRGWVLLTGGRPAGVMHAAMQGAKEVAGSITIGILPTASGGASEYVDVAVFTNMGDGRNMINVLSSDVVVVCGAGGAGTASEAALAIKSGKPLILLQAGAAAEQYFQELNAGVRVAAAVQEAVRMIGEIVG